MKELKLQVIVWGLTLSFLLFSFSYGQAELLVIRSATGATAHVSASVANRFQSLIRDLEAAGGRLLFMGGWRRHGSVRHSKHPSGLALDICQLGRGIIDRRCSLPSSATAIAAKYGLLHGAVWRNQDRGHFEANWR